MPTSEYLRILQARDDMSDWLIHFTRDDSSAQMSARTRLVNILTEGLLRPAWSLRPNSSGVVGPTIYGSHPAVCFTEQPLAAFAAYRSARRSSYVSAYGVVVNKRDVFAEGGLPVIYGVDGANELSARDEGFIAGQRTLSGVPAELQYRVVIFHPNRNPYPVDWTHEREWRWANFRDPPIGAAIGDVGHFWLGGTGRSTGLGLSFGRAHVFVERDSDVAWLQAQLAQRISAHQWGSHHYRDSWFRLLASKVGIVSLESVQQQLRAARPEFGRLETWPRTHLVPLAHPNSATSATAEELFHWP